MQDVVPKNICKSSTWKDTYGNWICCRMTEDTHI